MPETDTAQQLNRFSSRITQPRSQGASQAMLYGTGMTEDDMNKPQVGIASMWYEGNTCNMHLNDLAGHVHSGVKSAGQATRSARADRRARSISMSRRINVEDIAPPASHS